MKITFSLAIGGFFLFSILNAQNIEISGLAPGAEGMKIRVTTVADYISELEKPLDATIVDSNAAFNLEFSGSYPVRSKISIGFHRIYCFLEPGKSYQFDIRQNNYRDFADKTNPYLNPRQLEIPNLTDDFNSLNYLVFKFDSLYDDFLVNSYKSAIIARDAKKIERFKQEMQNEFGEADNKFLEDYVTYRFASTELVTKALRRDSIFRKYIGNQEILYNHPEYMGFFKEFFQKYIFVNPKHFRPPDLIKIIDVNQSYAELLDYLGRDALIKNEVIRELAFLNTMRELYYTSDYSKDAIRKMTTDFSLKTKFREHKRIAKNLLTKFKTLMPGTKAPDFSLPDIDKKHHTLRDFRGKPTYICFTTTWSVPGLAELELLKAIVPKYSKKIQFITISTDAAFETTYHFLLKNKYPWLFLYFDNDVELLEKYQVKDYPSFVLIDSDGNIIEAPAKRPSENVEAVFQNILNKR